MKNLAIAAILYALFFVPTGFAQFTYYAPQVVVGDFGNLRGWNTEFQLVNASTTQSVDVKVTLKNADGSPLAALSLPRLLPPASVRSVTLPPFSIQTIETFSPSTPPTSGWAIIEATGPLSLSVLVKDTTATLVTVSPGVDRNVITVNASATLMTTTGNDFLFAADSSASPFFGTGIAALNPSTSQPATLTFQVVGNGRDIVEREVVITLPPRTKIARFAKELGLFPDDRFRNIRLKSSQPIALVIVEIRDGAWIAVPVGSVSN